MTTKIRYRHTCRGLALSDLVISVLIVGILARERRVDEVRRQRTALDEDQFHQ